MSGDHPDNGMGRDIMCDIEMTSYTKHGTKNDNSVNRQAPHENGKIPRNDSFKVKNADISNQTDWPPTFSKIDIMSAVFGMFLSASDMVSDWVLAVSYYFDKKRGLFYLSAVFIIVPSIVSGIISVIWYVMERNQSKGGICLRVVVSFLQLGGAFRSLESAILMVKGRLAHDESRKQHLREKTIKHMQDVVILELWDGFLESALQLILQLYLTVSVPITMNVIRGVSLSLSLLSTAKTHASYYRVSRQSKPDKENVGHIGSICYFLWRMFELGPRFILIALSIHCFSFWCFIPVILHYAFMFWYFCFQNPSLPGMCPSKKCHYPLLLFLSFIGMFCFVNLKEGKTRKYVTVYYIIFYLENVFMAALIMWYSLSGVLDIGVYTYISLSFVPGCFLQFFFQFLFYIYFHPQRNHNKYALEQSYCTNL